MYTYDHEIETVGIDTDYIWCYIVCNALLSTTTMCSYTVAKPLL